MTMSSILDSLAGQLMGGSLTSQLSQNLGADEKTTQSAISAALPMILGALARNASKPEGASALLGALERDHDGGVLDDLATFLRNPNLNDGDGILRHTLGDRRGPIEQGVSRSSGIDPAKVSSMMATLAPVVMGALGKLRRENNLDAGALQDLLKGEERNLQQRAPEMGMLGSLLDADGDGSVVDDVIGKIGKGLLGGLFKKN
jgi:hypothetical protein